MQKSFSTPGPIHVYVEVGAGDIALRAGDVTETTVVVDGRNADQTTVEQRGDEIVVIGPRNRAGFLGSGSGISVHIELPDDSRVTTKQGSADLDATGRLGEVRVKSGSGEVRIAEMGAGSLDTGSGDVEIGRVTAELKLKSGSGDVSVREAAGEASISTGSGDVAVGSAARTLTVKSGSGDLRVHDAAEDVLLTTASGDLVVDRMNRGQLAAKNVSGDIHVGIPEAIPVWTDVSSVSGSVRSDLEGAGQPVEGQDYIEIRATTVSGDIALEQL